MTTTASERQTKVRAIQPLSPVRAGIAMALTAVIAGEFLGVRPPEAYGICMACHARDLMSWIANMLFHTRFEIAEASAIFPVPTTLGVLIGAAIASLRNGEFRWSNPDNPAKTFLYGILVMTFALIAGGCSTRLVLRTAAGDWYAAFGCAGMILGGIAATAWLRWRATR
jgi:hypothetical protein